MYSGKNICGLDEAGRGALAGPMVVAAVIAANNFNFQDVSPNVVFRDSKKLTNKQREVLYKLIVENSIIVDYEIMTVASINIYGINWANIEGFRRLINRNSAFRYIIDGKWKIENLGEKSEVTTCIIHADEVIPVVTAAGIVAKVVRDRLMLKLHREYPMYGWNTNTGHGTFQHIEAINLYGICEHHRSKFVTTALSNFL